MRRRVVRDIGTLVGVIVILAGVVFANMEMRRGDLKERMDKVRRNAEENQQAKGVSVLPWDLLRKTTGTSRSGPTFDAKLLENKEQPVSIVGFMVPQYEIRQMTEFLLLPVPIECYFCQMPPMRDVVLVQMAKDAKVDLVREPIVVSGALALNEGPGTKFFYVIKGAQRDAAGKDSKLTRKPLDSQHIQHIQAAQQEQQNQDQPLLPGQEVPKAPAETTPPVSAPAPPAETR